MSWLKIRLRRWKPVTLSALEFLFVADAHDDWGFLDRVEHLHEIGLIIADNRDTILATAGLMASNAPSTMLCICAIIMPSAPSASHFGDEAADKIQFVGLKIEHTFGAFIDGGDDL